MILVPIPGSFSGQIGVRSQTIFWMTFRRPLDCILEAFPEFLGPVFEGLNAILTQIYFQKRRYSLWEVSWTIFGCHPCLFWFVSEPDMGSKINLKLVQEHVRVPFLFVDFLIDFGVPVGVQNEVKTASKSELKIHLVLERLPPAGRVVLLQEQVLVLV